MSEAKRLLEQATPLPWRYFPDDGQEGDELQDGRGEMIASGFRDSVTYKGKPVATDAALIVYAVNRLPDYEAALDLLEAATDLLGLHIPSRGEADDVGFDDQHEVIDEAREALARLREGKAAHVR